MDTIMLQPMIDFAFINAQMGYGGIGQLKLACPSVQMALMVKIILTIAFKDVQLDHTATVFFMSVFQHVPLQEISTQILRQIDVFLYVRLFLHYMLKTMGEFVYLLANRLGID